MPCVNACAWWLGEQVGGEEGEEDAGGRRQDAGGGGVVGGGGGILAKGHPIHADNGLHRILKHASTARLLSQRGHRR